MKLLHATSVILGFALLLRVIVTASPVLADTIVKGRVTDPITESGVVGAHVQLRRGASDLALGNTDIDGYFELAFPMDVVPEQRTLNLGVEHDEFAPTSISIVITSGSPDSDAYSIELIPKELIRCRRQKPHLVIVGYFGTPATGADVSNLPYTLVTGLSSNLLPELQKRHLPEDFQPVFDACPDARPTSPSFLSNYAQVLGADVFVAGDVLETGPLYRVRTYVGDRHGVFNPPKTIVNENVAITDPAAAELDVETHAYMLIALANGYAKQNKYAECVDVCMAAEQVLGRTISDISRQLKFCQEHSENAGLVP